MKFSQWTNAPHSSGYFELKSDNVCWSLMAPDAGAEFPPLCDRWHGLATADAGQLAELANVDSDSADLRPRTPGPGLWCKERYEYSCCSMSRPGIIVLPLIEMKLWDASCERHLWVCGIMRRVVTLSQPTINTQCASHCTIGKSVAKSVNRSLSEYHWIIHCLKESLKTSRDVKTGWHCHQSQPTINTKSPVSQLNAQCASFAGDSSS